MSDQGTTWLLSCMSSSQTHLWINACLFLAILLVLAVLPKLVKYTWEAVVTGAVDREGFSDIRLPPGTLGYPLIGETISFLRRGCEFYKEKYKQHGYIYKTHLLGNPTVRVIGAENVRKILMGENSIVTYNWPTSARILLGSGSISQSTGHEHRVRRKHILHAFNLDTLQEFVPIMQTLVRSSISDWINKRGEILAYPESKLMTYLIASRLLIGLGPDSGCNEDMYSTFVDLTKNLMTIPFDLPGFGFRKGMNARRKILDTLRKHLPGTMKRPHVTIMGAYYDSARKLGSSEQEVYEGVLDLLFAGHETIASGNTNCVMFLGQHPRVVERLRAELSEHGLLEERDVDEEVTDLTYEKLGQLKYLSCVIKEVLRLCPPAGGGFRKVIKSFELGGYLIPKDWTVIYSIRETQHTSDIFVDSERFCPERWLSPELDSDSFRFHYLPFGGGARACVGKSYAQLVMKVFVVELVRMAHWTLRNPEPEMRYIPIPVATDHLPVTFRRRTDEISAHCVDGS